MKPEDTTGRENPQWDRLPPAALRYMHLHSALVAAIIVGVAGVVALVARQEWVNVAFLVVATLAVLAAVIDLVLVNLRVWRHYAFSVSERALRVRTGYFLRQEQTVSAVQVLSVKVSSGPVQRMFKLSTVNLSTVGNSVAIGPLTYAQSSALRDKILDQISGSGS